MVLLVSRSLIVDTGSTSAAGNLCPAEVRLPGATAIQRLRGRLKKDAPGELTSLFPEQSRGQSTLRLARPHAYGSCG